MKTVNALTALLILAFAQIASAGLPNSPVLEGEPGGLQKGKPVQIFIDKDKAPRYGYLDVSFVDPNLETQLGKKVVGASVFISVPGNSVAFKLEVTPCLGVEICPSVLQYISINMKIISNEFDDCGTKVIVAEDNQLPQDGDRKAVTIRDNTQNICPTFVALEPTEVSYETQPGGFFPPGFPVPAATHSTFAGPELIPALD